jgi:hypothetical protein
MLNFLLDPFEPVPRSPKGTDYAAFAIGLTRKWSAYKVWHDNINRVRVDEVWILYV